MKCYFKTFLLFLILIGQSTLFGAANQPIDLDNFHQTVDFNRILSNYLKMSSSDIRGLGDLRIDHCADILHNIKAQVTPENCTQDEINAFKKAVETVYLFENIRMESGISGHKSTILESTERALNNGAYVNARLNGCSLLNCILDATSVKTAYEVSTAVEDYVIKIIELFIKNNADVNMIDIKWNHYTPLMHAIVHKRHKIALFLIKNGADINLTAEGFSDSALSVLMNTFDYSSYEADPELDKYIIERSDLTKKIISYPEDCNPLFFLARKRLNTEAKRNRAKRMVELLIQSGVDINTKDSKGNLLIDKCEPNMQDFIKRTYQFYKERTQKEFLESTQNLLPTVLSMLSLSYLNF